MNPVDVVADPAASAAALVAAAQEAEGAGQSVVAMRAWQRVVQLSPESQDAWRALAVLHDELGDTVRADVCRKRAGVERVPLPLEPPPPPGPADADLIRFARRFGGREDTHARMWRRGDEVGWSPVPGVLGPDLARAHVDGTMTLGAYVLGVEGTARWIVVDLDVTRAALFDPARADAARARTHTAALALVQALRERGVDGLLEDSGHKGRHVWVFFESPVAGPEAFVLARALAALVPPALVDVHVESFPKQPSVREGGLGNLVKLPLGMHLRSGRRSALLDSDGRPLADPWERIRSVVPADPARLPRDAPLVAPDLAPVPAAPGPRPWTAADFEADPQVAPILAGCAMLRAVVDGVLRDRRISREESLILNHALGHLATGPRAVNYVYDRVPGFATEARMGAPHRGQVISCARIRQRLPDLVDRVGCDCPLDVPAGGYAHPLLHAGRVRPTPRAGAEEAIGRWARLEARSREIAAELDQARIDVVRFLEGTPDRRWAGEGGDWVLEDGERIRWEAWPSSS